jgi:hypothetical protein
MSDIKIIKDILVRDRLGVKRTAWVAGDTVAPYVYHAVLKTDTVLNPEDLPVAPNTEQVTRSLNTGRMETKVLPEEPIVTEEAPQEIVEKPKAVAKPKRKTTKKKAKK